MRDQPEALGLRPLGDDDSIQAVDLADSSSHTTLAASFFICGYTTNGLIGTPAPPARRKRVIPLALAASVSMLLFEAGCASEGILACGSMVLSFFIVYRFFAPPGRKIDTQAVKSDP
jgi:hypothetical protein